MKKSILVAPALAVLLIGAAGSVGGTVAWFSSVSSVEASANTFQATALDGSLDVVLAPAQGTAAGATTKAVKLADNCVMAHASYDHKGAVVYTKSNENANGIREAVSNTKVTGTAASSTPDNAWIARADYDGQSGHNIYYAVTWKMTFSYAFATESLINLYFDPASSLTSTKAKQTPEVGETNMDTYKGFRIAFVANAETTTGNIANTRVWGEERYLGTGQDKVQAKFIYGNDANFNNDGYGALNGGTAYSSPDFIGADLLDANKTARQEGTKVADGDKNAFDCLGQFSKTGGSSTNIVFTCIAWFEGTDPEIVTKTGMLMDTVTANMKFYTREATAPAQQQEEPQNNG